MGKGSNLWDDSALINAFDDAMATYKVMHSKTYHGDSSVEEKQTSDNKEHVLTEKSTGRKEPEDNNNNASSSATETYVPCYNSEVATEGFPIQENNLDADLHAPESQITSSAPESHVTSAGFPCIDGKTECYSDQQSADYNQLRRQYYELEEQKQKVVQQLHQASYWSYQTPVQCSTCQLQQVSAFAPSEHGLQPACSQCSCHCLAVPLIPVSACAIGGLSSGGYGCCPAWTSSSSASQMHQCPGHQCPAESGTCGIATSCMMDPMKQSTQTYDSAVKAGIMAAERVISSMKTEISATSNLCEEKEKQKDKEGSGLYGGNGPQGIRSETDLAVVLSAWYAAGFHTGRYLLEQSKRNVDQ